MSARVPIGRRIEWLAAEHPDRVAVHAIGVRAPEDVTWRELDGRANHCAAVLSEGGLPDDPTVVVCLPNGLDHVVATLAAWKLGATVVPLDTRLPPDEAGRLTAAIGPARFVGDPAHTPPCPVVRPVEWAQGWRAAAPPPAGAVPRSATATGGTTGSPRIILRRRGWLFDERDPVSARDRALGLDTGQVQLVTTPLFHSGFGALYQGLAFGHTVVLTPRFMPSLVADAIERYRVNVLRLVPTMMKMLLLPGVGLGAKDLSSVRALHHGTAPCPDGVKRAWLDLLGPERVFESYSSLEQLGFVSIRGDEWLAHPGSVGRPEPGAVVVVDDDGAQAGPGVVGRLFFRSPDGRGPQYLVAGERLATWRDGYFSVGDLGSLDADGYLYVRGRAQEVINVGGTNVYPAEIESVLLSAPSVADACVVPQPHDLLGSVPHALVVPAEGFSVAVLDSYCRDRLSLHKVPVSYEAVAALPRTGTGKLRRTTA
ncbi:class I adenylate-forming enzyme family protein [Actinophytocola glycyrrhizae]|uniref:Class I adenylate-forming enzyme family protein n=1 Tax=Actinophytocola glycyrrhizae TaxID=2044873 RepID=A0ABV9S356_9PSEU